MTSTGIMKRCGILSIIVFFSLISVCGAQECVQCQVRDDLSNYSWIETDNTTWENGVYTIAVECLDTCNDFEPAVGYLAKFTGTINYGTAGAYTPLKDIEVWSTPTDVNGIGYFNAPLLHEQWDGDNYVHLCPFDDVRQCEPPTSSQNAAPQSKSFSAAPTLTIMTPPNLCLPWPGCCGVTVTIKCTPEKSYSFCTNSSQTLCSLFSFENSYIRIESQWDADKKCNYCTGECEGSDLITLASFTATPGNGNVTLAWETAAEIDNAGFALFRAASEDGEYVKINTALIPARGSATAGAVYDFVDSTAANRTTYYYKLQDVDTNGIAAMHGPVKATPRLLYGIVK